MPVLAMALPIPPGKTEALEQHLADAKNHPDLDATLKGFGIARETWHVQETEEGALLILVFDADDPFTMLQKYASSNDEVPAWQRQCIKEILGVDLSQAPPAPPSRLIFDWSKE